jgi:hypothetical protein
MRKYNIKAPILCFLICELLSFTCYGQELSVENLIAARDMTFSEMSNFASSHDYKLLNIVKPHTVWDSVEVTNFEYNRITWLVSKGDAGQTKLTYSYGDSAWSRIRIISSDEAYTKSLLNSGIRTFHKRQARIAQSHT